MSYKFLAGQALALKSTAETMINAGHKDAADATTRAAAEALVKAAKQLNSGNPVIEALTVPQGISWSEVLMIANAVYAAAPA